MSFSKLPADIVNLSKIPYPEGTHYEYKATIWSCTIQKVYETICGFLNVGGGYMIFGIDDSTLRINGVRCTQKEIDEFILKIDKIYHKGLIITNEGLNLDRSNVKAESKILPNGNHLIVITVKAAQWTSYLLKDGTQIYRMNASNQNLGRGAMVSAQQQRQRNYQHSMSMHNQYLTGQAVHEEKVISLEGRIKTLEEEKRDLEEEVQRLNDRIRKMRSYMSWGEWIRSFFV